MLLIDTYLQKNNLKRYDVSKISGVSQQTLSNSKNKKALDLPTKVISAIAQSVGKTPGMVLDELIDLENENRTFVATDYERLIIALKNQEEIIIIQGPLLEDIRPKLKKQLTPNEKDVFEIGLRSSIVWVRLIHLGYLTLTGKRTDEAKLEEYLFNYDVLQNAKEEIILRDRRRLY